MHANPTAGGVLSGKQRVSQLLLSLGPRFQKDDNITIYLYLCIVLTQRNGSSFFFWVWKENGSLLPFRASCLAKKNLVGPPKHQKYVILLALWGQRHVVSKYTYCAWFGSFLFFSFIFFCSPFYLLFSSFLDGHHSFDLGHIFLWKFL